MNTKKIFLSALIGGLAVSAWADDAPGGQSSGPAAMMGSAPAMPAGIMADALRGAGHDGKLAVQRDLHDVSLLCMVDSVGASRSFVPCSESQTTSGKRCAGGRRRVPILGGRCRTYHAAAFAFLARSYAVALSARDVAASARTGTRVNVQAP